jgi:hypothetical protein
VMQPAVSNFNQDHSDGDDADSHLNHCLDHAGWRVGLPIWSRGSVGHKRTVGGKGNVYPPSNRWLREYVRLRISACEGWCIAADTRGVGDGRTSFLWTPWPPEIGNAGW